MWHLQTTTTYPYIHTSAFCAENAFTVVPFLPSLHLTDAWISLKILDLATIRRKSRQAFSLAQNHLSTPRALYGPAHHHHYFRADDRVNSSFLHMLSILSLASWLTAARKKLDSMYVITILFDDRVHWRTWKDSPSLEIYRASSTTYPPTLGVVSLLPGSLCSKVLRKYNLVMHRAAHGI